MFNSQISFRNFLNSKKLKLCIKSLFENGIEIFKENQIYEWKYLKDSNLNRTHDNILFKTEISNNFEFPMNHYEQQGFFHNEIGNFTYSDLKNAFETSKLENTTFEEFFKKFID